MGYVSRIGLYFILIFFAASASAITIPESFKSTDGLEENTKTWSDEKSDESVYAKTSKDTLAEIGTDAFAEIKETLSVKGQALETVLNIKDWKVSSYGEFSKSSELQSCWFLGSYINTSGTTTFFAEIYEFGKSGSASYVLTRKSKPWALPEISTRFKVSTK
ncbi:MAG: hypothetical protein V4736_03090 [Bdellovibrionota bacterium]